LKPSDAASLESSLPVRAPEILSVPSLSADEPASEPALATPWVGATRAVEEVDLTTAEEEGLAEEEGFADDDGLADDEAFLEEDGFAEDEECFVTTAACMWVVVGVGVGLGEDVVVWCVVVAFLVDVVVSSSPELPPSSLPST
jgi:hypothetical protein